MKAKILIVDDSALARRTLGILLEEAGHTVESASDGAQALERFSLGAHDLLILDLVMNGMYGIDVLARLLELNPAARVIVATADIQKLTAEQVRAAGAKGILNKPINRQQLTAAVDAVLEGRDLWT